VISTYERIDAAATPEKKSALARLSATDLGVDELAGEPITAVLTTAPGGGQPIGGVKVVTRHGWFAARPSGTEAVYKLYAESVNGRDHLATGSDGAQAIIERALRRDPAARPGGGPHWTNVQ
jgi:phosphoglucomutase